ncbi:glycosyltransferase family 4 protein [Algirhabdus cladophorae]|uniref:glycosyltransferase family 4 protein n=1 Tax=Algirhabdus cladophorae TaxID=3377108 RepID=UPI003B84706C
MSSLPRLAYLTALYPAASHTFIQREVSALRELGFEVETCSMRKPSPEHLIGDEEKAAFANTFYAIETGKKPAKMLGALAQAILAPARLWTGLKRAVQTAPPGVKGALKQAAYFAEALILAKHLKSRNISHLHNHFADPSANVAMLTSALSGIPFSFTLHGPAELYEPEKWQLRAKIEQAAFVACISHFCRSQAMYFSDPSHWSKLKIIHCGVLPERYTRPKETTEGTVNLLFVGRLTPIKGLRVLFEAFAAAQAQNPALTLTLVGDGDDRAHLEKLAQPLGEAVTFLGYQSQDGVADALAQADALVLPSFAEGLPVVLMEALAAATPVVCTQVAGVGELVEDGVSGYLVPASDVDSLTDRLIKIASDAGMRAKMGAAGREKVKEAFDVRLEAARIATLFVDTDHATHRPPPYEKPL